MTSESKQPKLDGKSIQEELAALSLLIRETTSNVITFALITTNLEREAAGAELKRRILPLKTREYTLSEDNPNPIAAIESLELSERHCIFFHDLEAALPKVAGIVNLQRETFATIPHALVFWVGLHGMKEIATKAPDFWAWRSGVFDFRTGKEVEARQAVQYALGLSDVMRNAGDLTRKISLYKSLIEDYGKEEQRDDGFIAGLNYKIGYAYFQLERIAEGIEFADRALEEFRRIDDQAGEAGSSYLLGMLYYKKHDFESSMKAIGQSLSFFESSQDEIGIASCHHISGMIAEAQGDFKGAEDLYRKSVEIHERLGDEHGAAQTYGQLGNIAYFQRDFKAAEGWYRRSLEIEERTGDEHGAAISYHQLGMLAQEQRDFKAAEDWYRKSLEIVERTGDEHGAASTYNQLGSLYGSQKNYIEAGRWLLKSMAAFGRTNDEEGVKQPAQNFMVALNRAPEGDKGVLKKMWEEAGLPGIKNGTADLAD